MHKQFEDNPAGHRDQFLSVTITPQSDTKAAFKSYANRFNADFPNWRFTRASLTDTPELLKRFAVVSDQAVTTALDHRNVIYLLNRNGDLIKQYAADPINVNRVIREMEQLIGRY
ncbi:MAG: SCO family protein [Pseudomonadota bacterium]